MRSPETGRSMSTKPETAERTAVQDLRESLEGLERLAQEFNALDLARRAQDAREPLERGELWIVVVGQFKRGKSTLLNALLGEAVLPTGVVPVTSVVTCLRWARERGLRVVFEDGRESEAPLASLPDFVSEERNPTNHLGVTLVEVGLPTPLLEGGLVLVDTPGIGSMDPGATGRAYAFLPRVDAAILVLSPDPPMGEVEGVYLQALLEHTEHLIFVLNKVDLHPEDDWMEAIEFNRRELARVRGVSPEEVDVVPVSSTLALRGRREGIQRLRQCLLEMVREKGGEVSRDAALRRLQAIATELRARLRVEERAIRLSDANLEERLVKLEDLRRELALRREEVHPILVDASRRLVERAAESLRDRADEVEDSLVESVRVVLEEHPELGNAALIRSVSDRLTLDVSGAFDAWWVENQARFRGGLREAMIRTAKGVDATGSTLASWVEEELGVVLPTPPPPKDLLDSHDFYYHVQGMRPELTVDVLGLLLPRKIFRWRLGRKARRLVAGDLDRNVGRIRGDLLYRAQETVRGFFAELQRRALAAEEGIRTALVRAARAHAGAREEGVTALERLAEGAGALEGILGTAGGEAPISVCVPAAAHQGGRVEAGDES
jgi:ribosome biogenesis GTPase A